jgi:hypothetical protein
VREEAESTGHVRDQASEHLMFRAMRQDLDGYPLLGRSSRTLGVRVDGEYRNLPVAEDGTVAPETGGMSVALEKPGNLPKHRLPRSLGGEGRRSGLSDVCRAACSNIASSGGSLSTCICRTGGTLSSARV